MDSSLAVFGSTDKRLQNTFEIDFWGTAELTERLKSEHEILEEFFGRETLRKMSCSLKRQHP
jgi:hypothetical protein